MNTNMLFNRSQRLLISNLKVFKLYYFYSHFRDLPIKEWDQQVTSMVKITTEAVWITTMHMMIMAMDMGMVITRLFMSNHWTQSSHCPLRRTLSSSSQRKADGNRSCSTGFQANGRLTETMYSAMIKSISSQHTTGSETTACKSSLFAIIVYN